MSGMPEAKRLLIVFHTQSGNTQRLLDAVVLGARDPDIGGVEVMVKPALEADAADVMRAHGILLGTPENFGYMSGAMKHFFDRIYYPCLDHTQGLPYGAFIRAGNDGQGARIAMERIIAGLRWRQVADPVIIKGSFDDADLEPCTLLGQTMAAGLEAGIF